MVKNRITISEALNKLGKKKLMTMLVSIVFFVSLLIGFFSYMYSSEKQIIMLQGEMSAVQSMEAFNRYIDIATNTIKASKAKIEKMLAENCTRQELLDAMIEDTSILNGVIDEGFSGVYGYIRGEYYAGDGWEPDDDYNPTERPWYKEAIQHLRKVMIIPPYIDADTGEYMTSMVLSLDDGESVIAIDITFDIIHKLITNRFSKMDNISEFIVDENGNVLAHSDSEQMGHNYRQEKDTLGAKIVENLYSGSITSFDVKYNNSTYVVHAVKINDDWYSISVTDSGKIYRPLRRVIMITIIVVILTILLLIRLYIRMINRNIVTDRLNRQLLATADVYKAVIDIGLKDNTCNVIRSNENIRRDSDSSFEDVKKGLITVAKKIAIGDSRIRLIEFANLDTLQERLNGSKTISMEFLSWKETWCRARFVVSQYDSKGNIEHVLWMVEVIDEEKRLRDELQDKSDRAIAESEAKTAFLSNMSHEIRTPINAVLGMNEMILRESSEEPVLEYAENIQTAGNTLLGLVNDILDLSKIEAGKMELMPVEYELSSVLNDLVNMIQPRSDKKGLALKLELDRSIPNTLYGDEIRIRQIITNILTNAVKYTNEGQITFRLSYDKLEAEPDYIIMNVAVKDTGIGIKKEDIGNLFKEYLRVDTKRNRSVEGTGLGLPIAYKLLDMMGSELLVESEYGVGSEFGFRLKQKVIKWEELGNYEDSYKRSISKRKRYKAKFTAKDVNVLVVDDAKMNLMVFKGLLKQTGINVDTALNGDEGIVAAKKKQYDIIFLDHMMPDKDGIDTIKELKELEDYPSKNAVIICLTANAISGAREKYLQAGFDDYLTKPIDSAKLESMLIKYLPEDKVNKL